jgi:hypothetical protein
MLGRYIHFEQFHHRRRWLSLAAGVAVAYVFVDMLPLMTEKQARFLEAAGEHGLPLAEFRIYLAALLGFTAFYGLEHLVGRRKTVAEIVEAVGKEEEPSPVHWAHVGGFALYNLMIGYLLSDWGTNAVGLALYCGALGMHLLITDDAMRRDYGARYDHWGRWTMASCLLAGALVGALTPVSVGALTIIVGIVAGGVVINSLKDELPSAGEGRFSPFLIGALAYAALIITATKLVGGE